MTYDVRNPDSGLEQAQQCGGVKHVNRIPNPSDNWISNNTDINKQHKIAQIRFHMLSQK